MDPRILIGLGAVGGLAVGFTVAWMIFDPLDGDQVTRKEPSPSSGTKRETPADAGTTSFESDALSESP